MNKDHLALLLRGVDEWNKSRFVPDLLYPDLLYPDLRGADLREANLRGADLRGAFIGEADLRGADLRGADLREANLQRADLRWASLHGADLRGAFVGEADLRWANLDEANLRGAGLSFAQPEGRRILSCSSGSGFLMSIVRHPDGVSIHAGCYNFQSLSRAFEHWSSDHWAAKENPEHLRQARSALQFLTDEARARGWNVR